MDKDMGISEEETMSTQISVHEDNEGCLFLYNMELPQMTPW